MYQCAVCGKPVQLAFEENKINRSCEHKDSPVVATARANCNGQGGLR